MRRARRVALREPTDEPVRVVEKGLRRDRPWRRRRRLRRRQSRGRRQEELIRRLRARAELADQVVVRVGARRAARHHQRKVGRDVQAWQLAEKGQRAQEDRRDRQQREGLCAGGDAAPALRAAVAKRPPPPSRHRRRRRRAAIGGGLPPVRRTCRRRRPAGGGAAATAAAVAVAVAVAAAVAVAVAAAVAIAVAVAVAIAVAAAACDRVRRTVGGVADGARPVGFHDDRARVARAQHEGVARGRRAVGAAPAHDAREAAPLEGGEEAREGEEARWRERQVDDDREDRRRARAEPHRRQHLDGEGREADEAKESVAPETRTVWPAAPIMSSTAATGRRPRSISSRKRERRKRSSRSTSRSPPRPSATAPSTRRSCGGRWGT